MFYSNKPNKFIQSYTPIFADAVHQVKVYSDAEVSKTNRIKDFKNNTIIFMLYNKVTGEVGSGRKKSNPLYYYY